MLRALRSIKSRAEVDKVRCARRIQSEMFARLGEWLKIGMTVRKAAATSKALMMELGADDVQYLVANSGGGGYDSIIKDPSGVYSTCIDMCPGIVCRHRVPASCPAIVYRHRVQASCTGIVYRHACVSRGGAGRWVSGYAIGCGLGIALVGVVSP